MRITNMKMKIKVKDLDGKILEKEVKVRNLDHLEACKKYKSATIIPKKGKGSYKRNKKISEKEY